MIGQWETRSRSVRKRHVILKRRLLWVLCQTQHRMWLEWFAYSLPPTVFLIHCFHLNSSAGLWFKTPTSYIKCPLPMHYWPGQPDECLVCFSISLKTVLWSLMHGIISKLAFTYVYFVLNSLCYISWTRYRNRIGFCANWSLFSQVLCCIGPMIYGGWPTGNAALLCGMNKQLDRNMLDSLAYSPYKPPPGMRLD